MLPTFTKMLQDYYQHQKSHENIIIEGEELSTNVMEVYEMCGQLYGECRRARVKEMSGVRFEEEYRAFREFLGKAYEQVVEYVGHYQQNISKGQNLNAQGRRGQLS